MILLNFPNFTVQAKNMLMLLEMKILCDFQTNQQTSRLQSNHTSLYHSPFSSDKKENCCSTYFVNGNVITEIKE